MTEDDKMPEPMYRLLFSGLQDGLPCQQITKVMYLPLQRGLHEYVCKQTYAKRLNFPPIKAGDQNDSSGSLCLLALIYNYSAHAHTSGTVLFADSVLDRQDVSFQYSSPPLSRCVICTCTMSDSLPPEQQHCFCSLVADQI